mgnify:CR=1 FL=1
MSRSAVVGAVLVLLPAAVVTWGARPSTGGEGGVHLRAAVPAVLGPWQGGDSDLDEGTLRLLRTDDWLNRTYDAPGRPPVTLTVVYSRRDRKTVHPPEVCLTAQGWEIEAAGRVVVEGTDGLEAASLTLSRAGERLHALYWYAAGERTTPSYVAQQWIVALGTLLGGAPGSAMVRLLAFEPPGGGREAADAALREFASRAAPRLVDALR